MERTLLKDINNSTLKARINSRKVKPMFYPNFFGSLKVESLKWETLQGEKGVPVMADVVSYDAPAPIKSRETVEKASGDIPKISIKRGMIESEYIKYKNLLYSVRGREDLKALLDLAFKDTDFCFNGVRGRKEWMAFQVLSTGELSLTNSNNAGVTTATNVDFQIPTANKTGVSTAWATAASATPIADLKAKVKAAREQGITIQHIVMRDEQLEQLLATDEAKDLVKYWINGDGKMLMNLVQLNSYFKANNLPAILTIDPTVRFESKNNKKSIKKPWELNRVALIPDLKVGTFQYGPIAAEDDESLRKKVVMAKRGDTLVSKWSEPDPYREWTKAEANTFPVLDDPDEIFLLRTDQSDWS